MTTHIEALKNTIPAYAKDLRLNLSSVAADTTLTPQQTFGGLLAAALASRSEAVIAAVSADAAAVLTPQAFEAAKTAAAIMAMNNVYYRFRHQVGKESYATKPARLRMTRLGAPQSTKVDAELFALAVSAINGCEFCVKAHEDVVTKGGLTDEHVHDAVRLAAAVHAAARSLP